MAKGIKAYTQTARTSWVLEWPAQVVLCVNQIYWTQNCATAIKRGRSAMRDFLEHSNRDLNDIVVMVRGKLKKVCQRARLGFRESGKGKGKGDRESLGGVCSLV